MQWGICPQDLNPPYLAGKQYSPWNECHFMTAFGQSQKNSLCWKNSDQEEISVTWIDPCAGLYYYSQIFTTSLSRKRTLQPSPLLRILSTSGRSVPYPINFTLSHMTCIGQWDRNRCDYAHPSKLFKSNCMFQLVFSWQ